MSPSTYRMMEVGANGSLASHGPAPCRPRLSDLGPAGLTSADCARLLPGGPGRDTARSWFRRPAWKAGP